MIPYYGCATTFPSNPLQLQLFASTSNATRTSVFKGQNTGSEIAERKTTSQSIYENDLMLECMILAE